LALLVTHHEEDPLRQLQGNWRNESIEFDGMQLINHAVDNPIQERIYTVNGKTLTVSMAGHVFFTCEITVDKTTSPKHVDLRCKDGTMLRGLLVIDRDRVVVAISNKRDGPRPKAFNSTSGKDVAVYILRRMK
jgi:uncharacterized protein (TIGR03067 family)